MEYKDYYKILGLTRTATDDEIKRAYRKLARKYHPDVSKEANAEDRFKEVQEAYEVLKDPQKRTSYDQLGSNWKSGQEFRPPPNWQGFGGESPFEGMDGNGFSDFFASIFGRAAGGPSAGFRQGRPKQRGQDERAKISITLEEAFQGGAKTVHLQVPEVDQMGQVQYVTRTLKINIPKGIAPGQQLRLANQGSAGTRGASPGDLYLEIDIKPHPMFSLQGHDIYLNLPITPWEAALGAKVTVPTLGGSVEMKIAAGAQSGQKLRLKGRGLPAKSAQGDQYVLLQIVTPPANTEAERNFYKKMAQELPFNPRKNF